MLKAVIIIITMLILGGFIFLMVSVPTKTAPPREDPPCGELVWMRDSPQARCVEYWKQRDLEEQR